LENTAEVAAASLIEPADRPIAELLVDPEHRSVRLVMAGLGGVRWSPDGSKILLQSASTEDVGALWIVEPDGSSFKRLFVDSEGRFAISPTWSPTGDQIMFALDPIADAYRIP
jgi:Tol biopolymer transport system component